MSPDALDALKKEFAIFEEEVSSALDSKLHLVLTHLYVEHLLERYISTKLKTTEGLFGQNGLTFEKKVCLAQAFGGFSSQHIDGIRKLNALRNDCVHRFKHRPSEKQINEFGRTLGKAYGEILKSKKAKNIESRLRVFCAHLCGGVLAVVHTAEH